MSQRRNRRFPVVATGVLLGIWPLALPLPAQPVARETIEVRLIEIDAIVTDRRGNPVHGLGPNDFILLENGRRQAITNLSEYRDGDTVVDDAADPGEAAASAIQRQPRTIAILIDALPLRGGQRRAVFQQLQELVDKTMREGDRAQVLTWHNRAGLKDLTPMTLSRHEVLDALRSAEDTLSFDIEDTTLRDQIAWMEEMNAEPDHDGVRFQKDPHVGEMVREAAAREYAVMRRKTAAIQRLLPAIADPARRNVLVYVSGSFPSTAGQRYFATQKTGLTTSHTADFSTTPMLHAVARTANAYGVIIHAIRPNVTADATQLRGRQRNIMIDMVDPFASGIADRRDTFSDLNPPPNTLDMMVDQLLLENDVQALGYLASETGGTVAAGQSGLKDAAERIANDLGSYYTLAYRTTSDGSDRERRIELRGASRSHVVRARQTILDRSDATRARDLLVARLFEDDAAGDLEFSIAAGAPARDASNQLTVPIELTIPLAQLQFEEEAQGRAARFTVLAVAGSSIGQITRMKEDSRRIVLRDGADPSGIVRHKLEFLATAEPVKLAIALFDERSGLAGVQSILLEGGEIRGDVIESDAVADKSWRELLASAASERKPIVVFFRPSICTPCRTFERQTRQQPAVQRRLSEVVFAELPASAGAAARLWSSHSAGLGVFDRLGNFRLHFDGVPDLKTFAVILDDIIDAAPHFERAATRVEQGEPDDAELEIGLAFLRLGRYRDARAPLERAIAKGQAETRQYARIARAFVNAHEARLELALEDLDRIIAEALTPHIAGEAWLTVGLIHARATERELADQAFERAAPLLGGHSRMAEMSELATETLEKYGDSTATVRIVPPAAQVITGKQPIRTSVASADVASVTFRLDGAEVARVTKPPFSASIDFGEVPEQRSLRVIAYDTLGVQVGQDEIVVNGGGERFWFRLLEPRDGSSSGPTRIRMALRTPVTHTVDRVTITWNDRVRAVVSEPPWETTIDIPGHELGILRGVAQLSDGQAAEDAVLLNATGQVERAHALLVELPITLVGADPSATDLTAHRIQVREGSRQRSIDSIQTTAPLTLGIIIDVSGSMQRTLTEVQEAAITFMETVLADSDRAFLVSFSSRATLVQTPTSDKELLRQKILGLRARGSTALFDAIAVGLLQMEGVKGRRALVVFTDGMDRASRYGESDVAELAKRSHVPIHLIAATPDPAVERLTNGRGPGMWLRMFNGLSRMAQATGGSGHMLDRLDRLPRVYQGIQAALQSQFLIFVRTDPGESANDWRRVQIAARGLTLHAPEGYYAPW